jgi:hypothetical protein
MRAECEASQTCQMNRLARIPYLDSFAGMALNIANVANRVLSPSRFLKKT